MFESYSGYRLLSRLITYLILCFFLGLLLGEVVWVLLIGAISLLFWHYRQLSRLNFWLWRDRRLTPPNGKGSWEGVFNGIYRLQGKNRKRVSQLAFLLGRFRQGAEALPDAAVVLDADYNIVWCNKLAQLLLGLVWPLDSGQRIDNLLRHPDFSNYLKNESYHDPFELASPHLERHVLEIRIMGYGTGQYLLIARDITRVRQLENMRKDFVANVSHELKTPLTVLQGYLEMMQEMAEPDSPNIKAMEQMQQQTHRMRSMVEQLLVLSRIEDSAENSLEVKVNMSHMMNVLTEEAEALSHGEHDLNFVCDDNCHLYGNEIELRSACTNLISNAIRYTPSGGKIEVSWKKVTAGAMFIVADTGDGIAPQHIGRLTERFYRVDSARTRLKGGTGLGLAITKHALSHHKSELMITSELGEGSQFSFLIPNHLISTQAD
ncbi:MAG: two-component system phosphate regulon sensor histidine kinase PhoR [Shewanella sp.]|jgi:two-component system phosphate regulon sensor histidine kinase PhoR